MTGTCFLHTHRIFSGIGGVRCCYKPSKDFIKVSHAESHVVNLENSVLTAPVIMVTPLTPSASSYGYFYQSDSKMMAIISFKPLAHCHLIQGLASSTLFQFQNGRTKEEESVSQKVLRSVTLAFVGIRFVKE